MARKKIRELVCEVISEDVVAELKQKTTLYFGTKPEYYALCNQEDCQYVDKNEPPCPLNIKMFEDDLREMEEKRQARRENR